jgi:hypothetical protein
MLKSGTTRKQDEQGEVPGELQTLAGECLPYETKLDKEKSGKNKRGASKSSPFFFA